MYVYMSKKNDRRQAIESASFDRMIGILHGTDDSILYTHNTWYAQQRFSVTLKAVFRKNATILRFEYFYKNKSCDSDMIAIIYTIMCRTNIKNSNFF
jgi:hypothetical protein